MKTENGTRRWIYVAVAAVFWVTTGWLTTQSTTAGADVAEVPVLSDSDAVLIGDVPMDRLVRLPFSGPGPAYYPDGSAQHESVVATGNPDGLVLYSNTLGYPADEVFVYRPGWCVRVADDLVTEAIAECPVTSVRVMVNGGVEGGGGTFSVVAELWYGCPGEGGQLILEPEVTFSGLSDDIADFPVLDFSLALGDRGFCEWDPRVRCSFYTQDCPDGLGPCEQDYPMIPPTVWLRLSFDTDTAGVVVGTPAQRGFSADGHHRVFADCTAWFGGYPRFPHASFWADLHSTTVEECPIQFLAYKAAADPFEPSFVPLGGPAVRVADDITLNVDSCDVSAYELGIVGNAGPFEMEIDLRWPSVTDVIEGTQNVFIGRGEGSLEVARFEVPPGATININDQPIWMTWQANRANTGVPLAPRSQVGQGGPTFAMRGVPGDGDEWNAYMLTSGAPAIFHASIFCRGAPPLGACCVAAQPNVPDQPPLCFDDLPAVACLDGRWLLDQTCAQNLFNPPCGEQACCLPNDSCNHLPRNECLANCEPSDLPIACTSDDNCPGQRTCGAHQCHDSVDFTGEECNPEAGTAACPPGDTCMLFDPTICTPKCARWNNSSFCGVDGFMCPVFECYDAEGDCLDGAVEIMCDSDEDCPEEQTCITEHHICTRRVGCENLACCNAVCREEPFCCHIGWDPYCVYTAWDLDECQLPPGNDECYSPNPNAGAKPVALLDDDSPVVCTPESESCTGVASANNSSATVGGSDPGFCCNKLGVDRPGAGTIWFKFTAMHETARVDTCASPGGPRQDTLIQVFDPQNPVSEEAACASLLPIGCNDDYAGCAIPTNSSICITHLTVGKTYYVLMASSSEFTKSDYSILRIQSPCPTALLPVPNDRCVGALDIITALTPFSLEDASFDCPAEPQLPGMTSDIWYRYAAPCSGKLTIHTCLVGNPDDPRPATNLAVYESWTCPPDTDTYGAWFNDDADFDKHCSIGGQECSRDSKCVLGCVGGLDAGELCEIDEECSTAICDTTPQAVCATRPEFPYHVGTGAACVEDEDCGAGLCEDDLWTECDIHDATLRCATGPDAGEPCFQNSDCSNYDCEPPCGWRDQENEIPWECRSVEECEPAECLSVCAPGSHLEFPAWAGEQFMIRLGGEYGGEPQGVLSVACEIDDCNANVLPDLWEIDNGYADDCNYNGKPDECDIDPTNPGQIEQLSEDCDFNGIPDECQIDVDVDIHCVLIEGPCQEGPFYCLCDCDPDVNANGIPDICDAMDPDQDGVPDFLDNCPSDYNPGQEDCDDDGEGDACEANVADRDDDGDTVCNGVDNCPLDPNPGQENHDGDALGDACDPDDDNDTIPDATDNCPLDANPQQEDCDGDGEGDVCEANADDRDDDGDGVCNGVDNCPADSNPDQKNKDGDDLGDVCDPCPKIPGPCSVPQPLNGKRLWSGRE